MTGGKGTATRTLGLLGSILAFAVDRGLRPDNPARGVKRFTDRRCERFLSPAELGRLGAVLEAMEAEGAHPYGLATIRLLAFTGARRSEIAALKWREVDLERGAPSPRNLQDWPKGSRSRPAGGGDPGGTDANGGGPDFVFPAGKGGGHYQGVAKVWNAARKRAELPGVRLHDLRHTFASFGAGGGFGLPVIGALLGHRNAATTARYAHLADDPLRKANDWIGGEIGAALQRQSGLMADEGADEIIRRPFEGGTQRNVSLASWFATKVCRVGTQPCLKFNLDIASDS